MKNICAAPLAGALLACVATTQAAPKANADMQAVLDAHAALGAKPLATLTPKQARAQPSPADAVKSVLESRGKPATPEPVGRIENRNVPGAAGEVPVRIYWPKGAGPFPVVFYIHGGGWVIANLDVYDGSARAITNAANAVVVSTHYRQAPEHPFPASHDDVLATYQWTVKNAASLQGDPKRIAVVGESAGGNMAANVSIAARDKGWPMPVHQVLIYPVANTNTDTESYRTNADAMPLDKPGMEWFFEHTAKNPGDLEDPRLALIDADLKGLPPTTIIAAEIDPLLSDGKMLADRLKAAGVAVDYREWKRVTHEFFGMGAVVPEGKEAVAFAAKGLKKGFAK